jgi:hypothetical protein
VNDVAPLLRAQTEALLQRVARERESRTSAIRDAAAEQARAVVVRARQEARARLRQAVDEERRQVERLLTERRAALETGVRRAEQADLRRVIARAWQQLPQAVASRWQDDESRAVWIRAACDYAARSLRSQAPCTVEFDPQCDPQAGRIATARLTESHFTPVEVRAVAGLGAGLRIRSGGACVDATVNGLLASRERVESELLAELDRLLEPAADGRTA